MKYFIATAAMLLFVAFVFLSLYKFMSKKFDSPIPMVFTVVTCGLLVVIGFYFISLMS